MDYFLIIFGFALILIGFIGCFVPVLPSVILAYAGLMLIHLSSKADFQTAFLITMGVLMAISYTFDYLLPAAAAKIFGGSKRAFLGAMIGMFAGLVFFPPFGMIAGAFLGALIAELSLGKKLADSLKASTGAFLGFILGIVIKVSLCGVILYYSILETFKN